MRRILAYVLLGLSTTAASAGHQAEQDLLPGCAWARLHPATGPDTGAWGVSDIAQERLIDSHTVFNIASVSKQFTALAVLLLAQDGAVDLDQTLSRYLPELKTPLGSPTLRQVLHHTGGLPDYIAPLVSMGKESVTVSSKETLNVINKQPGLRFPPGEQFEYSNTGYFLLSQIIEHVSGKTLADFSRQYIFEPLDMSETTIVDRYPSGINALARGYRTDGGNVRLDESTWEQTGDGQVHSNANDMLTWLQHLQQDTPLNSPSGKRTDSILSLLTNKHSSVHQDGINYQYGLEAMPVGQFDAWAHSGGWAGYRSFMAYIPGQGRGVVVMCNTTAADVKAIAAKLLR